MEINKGKKRELKGTVVSNSMVNTVRVRVNSTQAHPVYKKIVDKKKIFFAHTEKELNIGDKVTIRESKPYSKNVKWIIVDNKE
ncbi:30S ribosomal protein S17 [candidate division WS6 bacterium RIFOXYD1_FULL_33_8]|uniref:30S ribosomal protein S17 n=2 Tax=Candidatus Dojkabacteria TaxID=74243 RepID=A0A0G0CU85_9BACT|nr:ribosomal protein S17 [uncultured bacterium]KKP42856.1 MAG: 30S ribosomal protein S17, small subunit ribosomal protein S17 [candidate division WS6 bacterium GW2011_GWE2_33_157]KKP44558.1 MAG: 30S ribosomal protein S17, small subunit ribosomal protein S17 [candidate division WS6 bacterium GW2011_GWC1_33_20]KKP46132.1 MAG: 30S ribosomal protein S17, small subunit ribosomal protein S17 [candidate division WS6 bacterium GW2011_GWF1_33_233]KKP54655.1 MAG: 30S ribosomal protein S17 [candidate divi